MRSVVELQRSTGVRFRHVVFGGTSWTRARTAVNLGVSPAVVDREPDAAADGEEEALLRWIFEASGLDRRQYRAQAIRRRVPACLRALRVRSPAQARLALEMHPRLLATALSALVIGVTAFFRDVPVFATLRDVLLPALTAGGRRPRIWSVGCSDGAELYSVAMLLAEAGRLDGCVLLGTDCRSDAIAAARAGMFDAWPTDAIGGALHGRYLVRDGARWRVTPALRDAITWRVGNALTTQEPGTWDLIVCRNVAIYLHDDAVGLLWRQLTRALSRDGVVVTGKGERPSATTQLVLVAPCVYRRVLA